MKTYHHVVYDFSDKEIDLICSLMRRWSDGSILPIDRRSLTKQVARWAVDWKLLEWTGKGKRQRLHFTQNSYLFSPRWSLPTEALWRLVQPMLRTDESTGYSVVNHKGWQALNIYPQECQFASERDLDEKLEIFFELNQHHYIHFQCAGRVWEIYPEAEDQRW